MVNQSAVFKTSPYGDTEWMQQIQKRQFAEVLAALDAGDIKPQKDFCRFTFTQMAFLCGASPEEVRKFMLYDAKFGNNGESRTANGAQESYMMAANLVDLEALSSFLTLSRSHGKWQTAGGYLNRTVAHALFLPTTQKGAPTKDNYEAMIKFFYDAGVRFDVLDACRYTALDYARIYCPDVGLNFDLLDPKNQRCTDADLPDPDQIQDFWGLTSVQYAVMRGNVAKLTQLDTSGATFTFNGTQQTPLHILCCMSYLPDEVAISVAKLLIAVENKGEFPMNQPDLNGFYPLHNAAAFGMPGVFNYLLTLQYEGKTLAEQLSSLTDSQGRNAAHDVCMNGSANEENSIALTKTLLKVAGIALFMHPDKYGVPPIVYAYVCRPYLVNIIVGALNCDTSSIESYLAAIPGYQELIKAPLPSVAKLLATIKLEGQPADDAFLLTAAKAQLSRTVAHAAKESEPTAKVATAPAPTQNEPASYTCLVM